VHKGSVHSNPHTGRRRTGTAGLMVAKGVWKKEGMWEGGVAERKSYTGTQVQECPSTGRPPEGSQENCHRTVNLSVRRVLEGRQNVRTFISWWARRKEFRQEMAQKEKELVRWAGPGRGGTVVVEVPKQSFNLMETDHMGLNGPGKNHPGLPDQNL